MRIPMFSSEYSGGSFIGTVAMALHKMHFSHDKVQILMAPDVFQSFARTLPMAIWPNPYLFESHACGFHFQVRAYDPVFGRIVCLGAPLRIKYGQEH